MNDLLPAYAAGSLGDADRDRVRAHVASCAACRAELAAWQAIAVAVAPPVADGDHPAADAAGPPPDPARMTQEVLRRSAVERPASGDPGPEGAGSRRAARLRYLAALVLAEARLIRLAVPVASALVMALGVAVVLTDGAGAGPYGGDLLALVAPIVAAAGVAGAHRSRSDPAAELVAAAPTSGRLLLLVRLTLVLGYDLVLALAASAVLAAGGTAHPGGASDPAAAATMNALIGTWLGPMALLSSLSLLVAVRFGPDVALGTAVGLWSLRVLAVGDFAPDGWPTRLILEAWSTTGPVLAVSAAVGIAAVVAAGRAGPFPGEPGTAWRATHPM